MTTARIASRAAQGCRWVVDVVPLIKMSLPLPTIVLGPPPPIRMFLPVPLSESVLLPGPPIKILLPEPLTTSESPHSRACCRPWRIALPVPPAVRFVVPVKPLASMMSAGSPLVGVTGWRR